MASRPCVRTFRVELISRTFVQMSQFDCSGRRYRHPLIPGIVRMMHSPKEPKEALGSQVVRVRRDSDIPGLGTR